MSNSVPIECGEKYGCLTFVKELEPAPRGPKQRYGLGARTGLWKCDCGNEVSKRIYLVKSGNTQSCGCYRRVVTTKRRRKSYGEAALNLIRVRYQKGAESRRLEYSLSLEELTKLIFDKCFYCGTEPRAVVGRKLFGSITINGIDRLDSSKGYTTENCRTCCYCCNQAKSDMTVNDFYAWIQQLKSYVRPDKWTWPESVVVPNETGLNNVLLSYHGASTSKNREFNLSRETVAKLVFSPCFYCGSKPRNFDRTSGVYYSGIDRVDSSCGYTFDNVVPCCIVCNRAKSNRPFKVFLNWISQITEY